jgi:CDP-diacylglycerol--glycerol-3-phosphate 3-phosphatidyltransferase
MTIANLLSFSRIPLLFIVVGCLMTPIRGFATAALAAFILAVASDWLDGYFARKMKQVTMVGTLMDALIDKIFLLGLFFYFLTVNILPGWGLIPLLIMMTREFVITGLRQCALLHGQVMASELHGKTKTVVQFLSLFFLALVPFFQRDRGGSPEMLSLADFFKFAGRMTFALAAILTITSGVHYFNRYKVFLSLEKD